MSAYRFLEKYSFIGVFVFAILVSGEAGKKPYKLIYVDGHMHTLESDGSGTMEDIKVAALKRGLDAVIVTNHTKQITLEEWENLNALSNSLTDENFLMINAFEVTGSEGMFNRDHVLAWFVDDPFVGDDALERAPEEVWESPGNPAGTGPLYPENITKWTDYIHEHDGLAVHAHTSGTTNPVYNVDFIEVFNLSHVKDVAVYATMMGYPSDQASLLGLIFNNFAIYGDRDLYTPVAFDGFEYDIPLRTALFYATFNFTGTGEYLGVPESEPIRSWDNLLMMYVNGELDRPIFGVANSDAHNTYNIDGRDYVSNRQDDTYADYSGDYSDVGEVKNGVFIRKLTKGQLKSALKKGRCFATTGPSMNVTVNKKMMGQTAKIKVFKNQKPTIAIDVESDSPTSIIVKIDIIKNGEFFETITPYQPSFSTELVDHALATDCYYRVEVTAFDMETNAYSFAYSNPVFTRLIIDEEGMGRDDEGDDEEDDI
ncbi:MAG: hypothetical protein GF401_01080 [Chitinivibrionales bacterium]|nr:hypothetical protein [Chitinivibrionales bacterium]